MSKSFNVNVVCPTIWEFEKFLTLLSPNGSKSWNNFEFYINQKQGQFDFCVVLDHFDAHFPIQVKKGNIFFVSMEEKDVVPSYKKEYLNQFDYVITSRDDISHKNLIISHYCTLWHVKKSYDTLKDNIETSVPKTKDLSAIISSRVQYGTHLKRYAFINKLKGHFKKRLDWYSKNENPIDDKWLGLGDYRYSICIENGSHPKYFTEKIVDVILSDAVPIYWGAPDITDYFDEQLIVKIPLDDFEKAIEIIEEEIKSDRYKERSKYLTAAKTKILEEYQFLPWITKILTDNDSKKKDYQNITLKKEKKTFNLFERVLKKILDLGK